MQQKKYLLVISKLCFGLLGLSAIVTEIVVGATRGILIPANFFSYFTIESNVFAAIIFLASAVALLRSTSCKYIAILRGAAALYMITTGVIFGVLLSGYDPALLTFVPWDNIVLHYLIPVVVVVDWVVDPPKTRIGFKYALLGLVFPFVYLLYTLVRGTSTGWYPYPFLNPSSPQGYGGVIITAVGITVTVLIIGGLLIIGARLRVRKSIQAVGIN